MEIPLPPLAEQQEIVHRVESLFARADAIEARYASLKGKMDDLPQAILAMAFRGELVEQLETDGDARALLREIKKEKLYRKRANQKDRSNIISEKENLYSPKNITSMGIIEVIKKEFGSNYFTFEELEEVLNHQKKDAYIKTKQKIFELLRNEKYDINGPKLISEVDKVKGILKLKLIEE